MILYYSNENGRATALHNHMDGPHKHGAGQQKPTKESAHCSISYRQAVAEVRVPATSECEEAQRDLINRTCSLCGAFIHSN